MRSNAVLIRNDAQTESAIEVRNDGDFKGVYALETIKEGAVVFQLQGTVTDTPTKYTIQVGWRRHLNFPTIRKANDDRDYCWQFLNHSCNPNGYIDTADLTFRALRQIAPGDQITFNYLTTESAMAVPFQCICGATNCYGFIQGHNFLTPEEAARLASDMGEDRVVSLMMPARKKKRG
jgi:SET domain-containing protein